MHRLIERNRGFTLIELMMSIAVIAILAGVVVVGYGKWRESVAQKEVQSDLRMVAVAMKNTLNFNNAYPASLPSNFKGSPSVEVSYISGNQTSYCIEAVSLEVPTVGYFINTTDHTEPILGTCAGGPGALPSGAGEGSLDQGLIAWWKLNGNLEDSTTYGNNGTASGGVSPTADKNGQSAKAYDFDGGGSSFVTASFNSTSPPTNQLTLSIWAKKEGSGSNAPRGLMISSNGTYIDECYSGQVLFSLITTSGGQKLISGGSCPVTDGWHLYTATYTGTVAQLYIDGVVVGTGNYSSDTVSNNGTSVNIGRYNGGSFAFNGSLDDARMYNRGLSASEVQTLYSNGPR